MKFTEPTEAQAKFIAWTAPERIEGPEGEPITAGSQTIIDYYKGIKVSKIQEGGWKNRNNSSNTPPKTVRVEFDPSSIGLEFDIAANIAPQDKGLDVLRQALENEETVNIAIETFRKPKNSETGEYISPLTPISALNGAKSPGGKADMSVAKVTMTRVIAAVNGETTIEAHSDASQWASLVRNRAGNLAPEGFKVLSDPDDWTKYAVIVPTESHKAQVQNQQSGGGNVDLSQINAVISEAIDNKFGDFSVEEMRRYSPKLSDGSIGESQQWHTHTLRGEVSLGSYISSRYRYTYKWAVNALGELGSEKADKLTKIVMNLGLKVQSAAYGGKYASDPILPSYAEAVQWVCFVIENTHQFTENTDEWRNAVGSEAVKHMQNGRDVITPLVEAHKKPAKQNQSASAPSQKSNQQDNKPDQNAQDQSGQGDDQSVERLNECLEAIYKNWGNYEVIRAIYTQAKKENLLNSPVDVDTSGDQPRIVHPGPYTLKAVLSKRGSQLAPAPEKDSEDQKDQVPAPQTENVPAPQTETTPTQQSDDNDPVGAEDFASLAGGEVNEGSVTENTPVTDIDWAERLKSVSSEAEAQEAWTDASEYLQTVVVYDDESMKLSEAFGKLQEKFSVAQDIVESTEAAEKTADLNKLRTQANENGVLEFKVSDGHSDEPKPVKDILREKRESLKSE